MAFTETDQVVPNVVQRLLLVEDDEHWQNTFLQRLRHLSGWEIQVATSHDDLAAKLAAGQFGVLLLDESLWETRRVYEHQAAIQAQAVGGARLFCLSSSTGAAEDMATCFGSPVSAVWGKRNMISASTAELISAIEG